MRRSFFSCALLGFVSLLAAGCSHEGNPSAAPQANHAPAPSSKSVDSAPLVHREPSVSADYDASEEAAPSDVIRFDIGAESEGSGASADISAPRAEKKPALEAPHADAPRTTPPAESETHAKARDEAATRPKKQNIQSGLLTAGSFDDVDKFTSYQDFLTKTLQQDSGERFPRWAIGERVTIHVQTEQDEPLANARVEIRAVSTEDEQQQPAVAAGPVLATLLTGSDGRVLLLTGEDHVGGRQKLAVRVVAAGVEPLEQILEVKNSVWNIRLGGAKSELPQQLDLALVIDTTGSMGDELEYLKAEIDSIATTVKGMFPQVDQRFALVVYRDAGDQYVSRTFDFTSSLADFRSTLSAQTADGGGDYPEAMHLALEHAQDLSWRKDNTARVMFLVGDAPPHQQYARRTLEAGLALRKHGVRIYPLGASGVALEAEFIMRAMALASVGQYLFLTDHSGIGNAHATPHVPEFLVERLDRLMIRMIASELAGKRLAPNEVIAIERGEGINQEGLPPEPQQQPVQIRQTSVVVPVSATPWMLADITRWLMFGGLILGVFLLDAWDKHRQR